MIPATGMIAMPSQGTARLANTTVRNVRVYQDRGLLSPPRREGRVGIYTEVHLARLRLIGQLLKRGYTFANIAELVSVWERGGNLSEVLGFESAVGDPWSDEIPGYMTLEELTDLFGDQVTPERVARAVELGLLELEGKRYRVPSPRLLHAGAELVEIGMSLDAASIGACTSAMPPAFLIVARPDAPSFMRPLRITPIAREP